MIWHKIYKKSTKYTKNTYCRGASMYAELQMELETKEINYRQSSNLQGVIMENISPEYAARLHGNS